MYRGDAVGTVRADDGQVGHTDPSLRALLDEADAGDTSFVTGKAVANVVDQAPIDLEDDLEVARQHPLEPRERPLLERFGKEGVVRIRERPAGEIPRLVPTQALLVEQDSHQLGDGHGRV